MRLKGGGGAPCPKYNCVRASSGKNKEEVLKKFPSYYGRELKNTPTKVVQPTPIE